MELFHNKARQSQELFRAHLLIDAVLRSKLISISLKDETGLASQVKTKSKENAQIDIDNQVELKSGQRK